MAEYIEREAALKVCNEHYVECLRLQNWSGDTVAYNIADGIRTIPAADVAPVVHGEWLKTKEPLGWHEVDGVECSVCHESWILDEDTASEDLGAWHYCPNCGAKMDGGTHETD